jgi:hypothetical protein
MKSAFSKKSLYVFGPSHLAALSLLFLCGCAGVDVTSLNPNGSHNTHAADGVRYYLPAPYLLVVELPPTIPGKSGGDSGDPTAQKAAASPGSTNTTSSTSMASPGPASDVSFSAATPQYMIKLIYLPDFRHPMAITESAGIGTADMKPNLQDGWMLTSLDSPVDSKVPETITAVSSLISSIGGDIIKTEDATSAGPAAPAPQTLKNLYKDNFILRPGLYRFAYGKNGALKGLERVTLFGGTKGAESEN